jgi:hypothetical protein
MTGSIKITLIFYNVTNTNIGITIGLILHLITSSMKQSLFREADSRSDFQEIPCFYGTRKVTTVFARAYHWTLSYPVESTPHLYTLYLKINFNIIRSSKPKSPKRSLPFRIFDSNLACISYLSIHSACPIYFILLDLIILI